jgi:hypothetical protein
MFEGYNLVSFIELRALTFGGSYPRRELQDCTIHFLNLYVLSILKLNSFTILKIA